MGQVWLMGVGFVVLYGPLLTKLWRVTQIFVRTPPPTPEHSRPSSPRHWHPGDGSCSACFNALVSIALHSHMPLTNDVHTRGPTRSRQVNPGLRAVQITLRSILLKTSALLAIEVAILVFWQLSPQVRNGR